MKKQDVLRLLDTMPEEIDMEELMYRLHVMQMIEVGEAAFQAGDVVPHEEVEREIEGWLHSSGPAPRSLI